MPLFYFDVFDGQVILDDVGTELPDLEAAKQEVARTIGGVATEMVHEAGGGAKTLRVHVRDAFDSVLYSAQVTVSSQDGD